MPRAVVNSAGTTGATRPSSFGMITDTAATTLLVGTEDRHGHAGRLLVDSTVHGGIAAIARLGQLPAQLVRVGHGQWGQRLQAIREDPVLRGERRMGQQHQP